MVCFTVFIGQRYVRERHKTRTPHFFAQFTSWGKVLGGQVSESVC